MKSRLRGQDSRRAFAAALILAVIALSALAGNGATSSAVCGTVIEFESREWITVVNETTDPTGVRFTLRSTTTYDGNPATIVPGARVTVRYRSVGERHHVADKVRVLSERADAAHDDSFETTSIASSCSIQVFNSAARSRSR
jgi:hypothetical protein